MGETKAHGGRTLAQGLAGSWDWPFWRKFLPLMGQCVHVLLNICVHVCAVCVYVYVFVRVCLCVCVYVD
jgi:hypothetical protein